MPKQPLSATPAKQLAGFIAKFDPTNARLIRALRTELRQLLPTAIEIVYDNYNFFVIGYSTTERPSDCIVSLAAAANGVGLSFYYGSSLPDPQHLLLGSGKQNRFVRLPDVKTLCSAGVRAPHQGRRGTGQTTIAGKWRRLHDHQIGVGQAAPASQDKWVNLVGRAVLCTPDALGANRRRARSDAPYQD